MVRQFVFWRRGLQRLSWPNLLGTFREGGQRGNNEFYGHVRSSRANILLRVDRGQQFQRGERDFNARIHDRTVAGL